MPRRLRTVIQPNTAVTNYAQGVAAYEPQTQRLQITYDDNGTGGYNWYINANNTLTGCTTIMPWTTQVQDTCGTTSAFEILAYTNVVQQWEPGVVEAAAAAERARHAARDARIHDLQTQLDTVIRNHDELRVRAQLEAQRRLQVINAASTRALALLQSFLDDEQKKSLQQHRYFDVISRHSRRRYRIHYGTHGNVRLLNEAGREVTRYCAQPEGVPTEDAMLAQLLMIRNEEAEFLNVANATRIRTA